MPKIPHERKDKFMAQFISYLIPIIAVVGLAIQFGGCYPSATVPSKPDGITGAAGSLPGGKGSSDDRVLRFKIVLMTPSGVREIHHVEVLHDRERTWLPLWMLPSSCQVLYDPGRQCYALVKEGRALVYRMGEREVHNYYGSPAAVQHWIMAGQVPGGSIVQNGFESFEKVRRETTRIEIETMRSSPSLQGFSEVYLLTRVFASFFGVDSSGISYADPESVGGEPSLTIKVPEAFELGNRANREPDRWNAPSHLWAR